MIARESGAVGGPSAMRARVAALTAGASGDELAVIRTILESYLCLLPVRLDAVMAAVRDADAEQLTFTAHALKGASANLGAGLVAEVAAQIEECGREGQLAAAASLLELLTAATDQDESEMRSYVNNLGGEFLKFG